MPMIYIYITCIFACIVHNPHRSLHPRLDMCLFDKLLKLNHHLFHHYHTLSDFSIGDCFNVTFLSHGDCVFIIYMCMSDEI